MKYSLLLLSLTSICCLNAQTSGWGLLTEGQHNYLTEDSMVVSVMVDSVATENNVENRALHEWGLDWGGTWQVDSSALTQRFGDGQGWSLPMEIAEGLEWDFTDALKARCAAIEWGLVSPQAGVYDSIARIEIDGGGMLSLSKKNGLTFLNIGDDYLRLLSIEKREAPELNVGRSMPHLYEYFVPEEGTKLMTEYRVSGQNDYLYDKWDRFRNITDVVDGEEDVKVHSNVARVIGKTIYYEEAYGMLRLVYGEVDDAESVIDTISKDSIPVLTGQIYTDPEILKYAFDLDDFYLFGEGGVEGNVFLMPNGKFELVMGGKPAQYLHIVEGVGIWENEQTPISPRSSNKRRVATYLNTRILSMAQLVSYQNALDVSILDYAPAISRHGQLYIASNDEVFGMKTDSITTEGDSVTYHLMKSPNKVQNGEIYQYYGDSWLGNKIVRLPNGDLHIYTYDYYESSNPGVTVYEIPDSTKVGDNWLTGNVEMTLDSIIAYKGDMVKAFSVNDGEEKFEFWLGKNKGIWKSPIWESIGFETSTLTMIYEQSLTNQTLERVDDDTKGVPVGDLTAQDIYDLQVGDELHILEGESFVAKSKEILRVIEEKVDQPGADDITRRIIFERCMQDDDISISNDSVVVSSKDTMQLDVSLLKSPENYMPYEAPELAESGLGLDTRAKWDEQKGAYKKRQTELGKWTMLNNGKASFEVYSDGVYRDSYSKAGGGYTSFLGGGRNLKYRSTNGTEWGDPYSCYIHTGEEDLSTLEFSLYPNPSNGSITVQLPGQEQVNLEVFDIEGRLLKELIVSTGTLLDLNVKQGIYFVRITAGQDKSGLKKLVITE